MVMMTVMMMVGFDEYDDGGYAYGGDDMFGWW